MRERKMGPFAEVGPILPQIAAKDLETMIELLGARSKTIENPKEPPPVAADDLKPRAETYAHCETGSGVEQSARRERGYDLVTIRERMELLERLRMELATIHQNRHKHTSADELRR